MVRILAHCGTICNDCPAYVATQANDMDALQALADKWRTEYDILDVTVEQLLCDGCVGEQDRQCGACAECIMRLCAMEKGVATCAHCPEYVCAKLVPMFEQNPAARTQLDALRAELG